MICRSCICPSTSPASSPLSVPHAHFRPHPLRVGTAAPPQHVYFRSRSGQPAHCSLRRGAVRSCSIYFFHPPCHTPPPVQSLLRSLGHPPPSATTLFLWSIPLLRSFGHPSPSIRSPVLRHDPFSPSVGPNGGSLCLPTQALPYLLEKQYYLY